MTAFDQKAYLKSLIAEAERMIASYKETDPIVQLTWPSYLAMLRDQLEELEKDV